ncbi:MAG: polyprenyl synthetase family protein [Polyangiaceae bacterium]|jgi:geranylgeranyl diphosphate synthase, type I
MMTGGPAESPASERRATSFAELVSLVRRAVESRLLQLLDGAVAEVRTCGPDAVAAIEALRSLSMRGGKRFRPVLVAAAHEACGGSGGSFETAGLGEAVVLAGAAIELLQAYLLIHDDWMDADDVRRGGPSVHAMLRSAYGDVAAGDAAAILAGDYASALAQQALFSMPLSGDRVVEAGRAFARVQREVISGQLLDLRGAPGGAGVESMHDLKTGSYTVRGPLAIGAILAGATAEQRAALDRFAAPLGVAFQLRDDLLGTFGDPKATGKPAGNDIRRGKRTALVAALAEDADARPLMKRAFGVGDASDADVAAVVARMEASGARAKVEARLHELLASAERELVSAPLGGVGKGWLQGAVKALGERDS